jgi:hypothetical protein
MHLHCRGAQGHVVPRILRGGRPGAQDQQTDGEAAAERGQMVVRDQGELEW